MDTGNCKNINYKIREGAFRDDLPDVRHPKSKMKPCPRVKKRELGECRKTMALPSKQLLK